MGQQNASQEYTYYNTSLIYTQDNHAFKMCNKFTIISPIYIAFFMCTSGMIANRWSMEVPPWIEQTLQNGLDAPKFVFNYFTR